MDSTISEVLNFFVKQSMVVLDTNMFIFNYEYLRDINQDPYNFYEFNKKQITNQIFSFLSKKQIPIIMPKIILNEIKKVMKNKGYIYDEKILFNNLNIIKDCDENFEFENRPLAQKLFYESCTDLMIYIYCKEKEIQIIITDDRDFFKCEEKYNENINLNKIKITIANIEKTIESINLIEGV